MKPSAFESAVLERIAANSDDEELRDQLSLLEVVEREHTGVGCYTKISVRDGAGRTSEFYKAGEPLHGPDFESTALEAGGLTLLWFKDGFADTLEICTFTGDFPENHDELSPFTLDRSTQQSSDSKPDTVAS